MNIADPVRSRSAGRSAAVICIFRRRSRKYISWSGPMEDRIKYAEMGKIPSLLRGI